MTPKDLRDIANFMENNPDLEVFGNFNGRLYTLVSEKENLSRVLIRMRKLFGRETTNIDEIHGSADFVFQLNPNVTLNVFTFSLCKRVQVGTKRIASTPEHDEPIYEIQCEETI